MNYETKSGLRYLVIFHRLTCNSFVGWNFGKKLTTKTKLILIFTNIILFFICGCFNYVNYDLMRRIMNMKNHITDSHSKSQLLFILLVTTFLYFPIQMTFIFFVNLFTGKSILTFLWKQNIKIDPKVERMIGIKLITVQFISCLIIELPFSFLFKSHETSYLTFFRDYFLFIIVQNVSLILLSLMAYQSYVIEQKFTEITDSFTTLIQLKMVCNQVFTIAKSVKRYDKFFNIFLFMTMLLNTIHCICSSTIIYFDRGRQMPFTIPTFMESLFRIYMMCFISAKLGKGYERLLDKFETLEESNQYGYVKVSHSLVMRLYGMRDQLCYTAFNIYPINMKTFMSIVSMIVTFSVILIQTN